MGWLSSGGDNPSEVGQYPTQVGVRYDCVCVGCHGYCSRQLPHTRCNSEVSMSGRQRRRRKYRDSARRQARQQQAMVVPTITDVVEDDPIPPQPEAIQPGDFESAHEHERRALTNNEWKYTILAVLMTGLAALAVNAWLG